MKNNILIVTILISFVSCEKAIEEPVSPEVMNFVELNASQYVVNPLDSSLIGKYERFSFSEGDTVSHDNWDVAFRGSTIIVNGGYSSNENQPSRVGNAAVYIINGTMSDIDSVDLNQLLQDTEDGPVIIDDLGISGQGWSSYDMNTHILSPIAGKILVFRTHDEKYAKMEILYYYDSPNPGPSDYGGFYTFNYVYQSNGTHKF